MGVSSWQFRFGLLALAVPLIFSMQSAAAQATEKADARKPATSQSSVQRSEAGRAKAKSANGAQRAAAETASTGKAAKSGSAKRPVASSTAARKNGKKLAVAGVAATAVASEGRLAGLHAAADPLELKSGVALVIDRDSQEVLVSKNTSAVLPIASITKLMTAIVVVESGLSLDEPIRIEEADADETFRRRSRLVPGTSLTRGEMLRLALMSSENRAAHALSRSFPGGTTAFVAAMNRKAESLGMSQTRFVEATGLSPENRSSAVDLATLVTAASAHQVISEYSVAQESLVPVGKKDKLTQFRSTNGLIGKPEWDISLQKTGYISAAGRCLVMQASLAGRRLTMVLLDSAGKYSRMGDAERIRQWLLGPGKTVASAISATQVELKP